MVNQIAELRLQQSAVQLKASNDQLKGERGLNWRQALTLGATSFLCGSLIGWYAFIPFPYNLIASLGAFFVGVWFFRKFETRGMRITFVVLSIFYLFAFLVLMAMVEYTKKLPINA
ncbi:hypothetical protein NQ117_16405 [Paenibacillus sp. SC116]|uniref:hypothetical protein n=1 Tax=Paenibacillus sp. SC116 TaxID=2968986 RepID=UPI00215B3402|nr:hypothetical protein [Paenibacillus sp. SC116]MCR8845268.1 hypothetical protein [Paenibacillus sp. SC116]